MLKTNKLTRTFASGSITLGVLAGIGMVSAPVHAITLTNRNSTAEIFLNNQAGLQDWTVDGTDYMFQEWSWYRIGTTGPEASIDSLTLTNPGGTLSDDDGDGENESLEANYQGNDFTLDALWTLTGGAPGSGISDIAEVVEITNTSASALEFYLFEYTDFDFGDFTDDDGVFDNINVFRQFDANVQGVISQISIDDLNPRYEISPFPLLLNSLNNGSPTTLSNTPSIGTPSPVEDVTSAWQWRFLIEPGDSVIISKDKQVEESPPRVPEPGTVLGLLAVGGLGMLAAKRSKKAWTATRES